MPSLTSPQGAQDLMPRSLSGHGGLPPALRNGAQGCLALHVLGHLSSSTSRRSEELIHTWRQTLRCTVKEDERAKILHLLCPKLKFPAHGLGADLHWPGIWEQGSQVPEASSTLPTFRFHPKSSG